VLRSTFSNEYYVIAGDVGTGKTRSVVEVIRSMMADDGRRGLGAPIYVLANQGTSFAETLGAAVGFRFDEHISFRFFVNLVARINSNTWSLSSLFIFQRDTRCSTHAYHSRRQKLRCPRTACVEQFTGYSKTDHQLQTV